MLFAYLQGGALGSLSKEYPHPTPPAAGPKGGWRRCRTNDPRNTTPRSSGAPPPRGERAGQRFWGHL